MTIPSELFQPIYHRKRSFHLGKTSEKFLLLVALLPDNRVRISAMDFKFVQNPVRREEDITDEKERNNLFPSFSKE